MCSGFWAGRLFPVVSGQRLQLNGEIQPIGPDDERDQSGQLLPVLPALQRRSADPYDQAEVRLRDPAGQPPGLQLWRQPAHLLHFPRRAVVLPSNRGRLRSARMVHDRKTKPQLARPVEQVGEAGGFVTPLPVSQRAVLDPEGLAQLVPRYARSFPGRPQL